MSELLPLDKIASLIEGSIERVEIVIDDADLIVMQDANKVLVSRIGMFCAALGLVVVTWRDNAAFASHIVVMKN